MAQHVFRIIAILLIPICLSAQIPVPGLPLPTQVPALIPPPVLPKPTHPSHILDGDGTRALIISVSAVVGAVIVFLVIKHVHDKKQQTSRNTPKSVTPKSTTKPTQNALLVLSTK